MSNYNRLLFEKHKVSKGEYVELYRDDDFVLVVPLTHEASKKYGSNAKWCTTKKDCDKEFQDHIRIGVLAYIVIRNNELKKRFENNVFAMYRLYGDNIGRMIAFDDKNEEYKNGEQWLSNKFDRHDKLFQFYKMIGKFNEYFESASKENNLNESENKIDQIDQNIFNFLRRRHETKEQVLGKDDYAITVYTLTFNIKNEFYSFNNYMSKKDLTYRIVNMLEEKEAISLGEYNPRIFDENRQKVVQTVRFFLDNFFNVKNKKPINEEYKYEINEVEPILKLVLMQKYDWLKDLKLKNLRILEFGMIFINGLMIVDEEWGAKKWREQYMETSFPGNSGWEDGDYYDIVALGDILGKEESEEIKNEIIDIVKYVTGKEIKNEGNMSFALKFV